MNAQALPQVIGIGFGLAKLDGAVTIVYVVPNTPASRAGLSAGFIINKIDGAVTVGMQPEDWERKLRGDVGTSVRLELTAPANSQTSVVDLVREKFVLPAVLPS
jgi:carboxyl-terminal processing protease